METNFNRYKLKSKKKISKVYTTVNGLFSSAFSQLIFLHTFCFNFQGIFSFAMLDKKNN